MKYLQITNKGEINPNALSLMGASTKRGDSGKIGFFGTGNKYALSLFLSKGLDVVINSGLTPIEISTKPVDMDGHKFSVVIIDGKETSITTNMGPTWELWQAIREVYSNALDGGDADIKVVDEPELKAGFTNYCIEADGDVLQIMNNFDSYFSTNRKAIEVRDDTRLYANGTGTMYRQGIRCLPEGSTTMFDYEVGNVTINEERLASYSFQLGRSVWSLLLGSEDKSTIERALNNTVGSLYIEPALLRQAMPHDFDISEACKLWLSENLVADESMSRLMTEAETNRAVMINSDLLEYFVKQLGIDNVRLPKAISKSGNTAYAETSISHNEMLVLKEALRAIAVSGIEIKYPITTVTFSIEGAQGMADVENQRILLDEKIFSIGVSYVISTILEEWVHLKHGVHDETRAMQTATFNEFASLIVINSMSQEVAA